MGAAIALGAMLVMRLSEACGTPWDHSLPLQRSRECDAMNAVAPAVRGPLLVCLHVVLYGAAVQAWSVTRVNNGFIFQARRGTELPATGAVLAGSLAACAWFFVGMILMDRAVDLSRAIDFDNPVVDVSGELRARHLGQVFREATAAVFCMLVLFVFPVPERLLRLSAPLGRMTQHPPNSTRRFMLSALGRGVCAPAFRVRMMDFFLMDQIVSQAAALRDVLAVVLLACGSFTSRWVRYAPAVGLLPGWLRLLQVIRRFRDDGNAVHLVNAGKYATGVLAVAAGLCLRYAEDGTDTAVGGALVGDAATAWRHAYNWTTYLAVFYGGTWDLFQDWSVFSLQRPARPGGCWRARVLQRRLMIRSRWKYFAAIGVNVVLRNMWIVASVPINGSDGRLSGEVWMTMYATLEVCRRCMWNYFRVENEHTTNCGMFRATLEVPLPFEDGELTEDEDDDVDSVGGASDRTQKSATGSLHGRGGGGVKHGSSDDDSEDGEDAHRACLLTAEPRRASQVDAAHPVAENQRTVSSHNVDDVIFGEDLSVHSGKHVDHAGRSSSAAAVGAGAATRAEPGAKGGARDSIELRRISIDIPVSATPNDRRLGVDTPLATQKSAGLQAIMNLLAEGASVENVAAKKKLFDDGNCDL